MGALTQSTQQVIHLAATMILARLLLPEHFGVIATALVIVNFFSMIRDFGLSEAIMRRQDIDQCHYPSIFFLHLIAAVPTALLMKKLKFQALFIPRAIGTVV